MNGEPNYYDVLGVGKDATDEEIKQAARRAALEAHPDRDGGSHELMVLVNRAADTLKDRLKRKEYDETGEVQGDRPVEYKARDRMCATFMSAVLTDEPDPLVATRARLLQDREEHTEKMRNIAHRHQAVVDRKKRLKKIRAKADVPDVLARVIDDLLVAIGKDTEAAVAESAIIDGALKLLDEYKFEDMSRDAAFAHFLTGGKVIAGPSAAERNAAAAEFWKGR